MPSIIDGTFPPTSVVAEIPVDLEDFLTFDDLTLQFTFSGDKATQSFTGPFLTFNVILTDSNGGSFLLPQTIIFETVEQKALLNEIDSEEDMPNSALTCTSHSFET